MRIHLAVIALSALIATAPAAEVAPPLSSVLDPQFFAAELWKDGQAEVARYDLTFSEKGEDRKAEAVIVTRLEDINREYQVKAEWPWGQKPVYKAIRQAITATMPFDASPRTTSVYTVLPLETPARAVRLTATSSDWDGMSLRDFQLWSEPAVAIHHSSKDGIGSGKWTLDRGAEARFEEELPLVLRALRFEDTTSARLSVYPTQFAQDGPRPAASPSSLTVSRITGEVGGWLARVESEDGRVQELLFDEAHPHVMREWIHSDGRHFRLRESSRSAYWLAQP